LTAKTRDQVAVFGRARLEQRGWLVGVGAKESVSVRVALDQGAERSERFGLIRLTVAYLADATTPVANEPPSRRKELEDDLFDAAIDDELAAELGGRVGLDAVRRELLAEVEVQSGRLVSGKVLLAVVLGLSGDVLDPPHLDLVGGET